MNADARNGVRADARTPPFCVRYTNAYALPNPDCREAVVQLKQMQDSAKRKRARKRAKLLRWDEKFVTSQIFIKSSCRRNIACLLLQRD